MAKNELKLLAFSLVIFVGSMHSFFPTLLNAAFNVFQVFFESPSYFWSVIFLRGGHLSCNFLTKAPRTCQNGFNDENKNECKGEMFWLTREAAGISGIVVS